MRRFKALLTGFAILIAAAAVRLPTLTAGLPYMTYVDEGHVLHHVVHLLAAGTWEPDTYSYPSLPFYLVAGAALAYSPLYAARHGQPLRADLSPDPMRYYEILEPTDLLVLGRLVTLAFSLGIVLLAGLLARRLAGPAAGLFAAWLAALVPALVARSSIANINPMVAFFGLAALFFAERARDGGRPRRDAILAGVMVGLTGATKYPAALICLPVAVAILLADAAWRERLTRLVLAGGSAVAALLLAMPALVLRTGRVLAGLREMSAVYGMQEAGSYWDQAVRRGEWDLPLDHPEVGIVFLVLAAAGLLAGLSDRRWSKSVWGWLLFGAATALLVAPYKFRAFRNLLTLVPLACVLVALLYAKIRQRAPRRLWVDLAAAVLPIVLFAPALNGYIRHQLGVEDSREQAIRWLAEHTGPRDKILFSEEIAILPSRIATLKTPETDVKPWGRARDRVISRRYHYLVLGQLVKRTGQSKIPPEITAWILLNYEVQATFGSYPTHYYWKEYKGNGQAIYILKRVPRKDDRGRPKQATRTRRETDPRPLTERHTPRKAQAPQQD
ncbi:MAG TPA: glycosyltransferase family 39 protein [Thermoanaerobaculia bacterium]|nr:glycosyltransferase family 39 protein [Thermoanaerobaculia bacterium]